MRYGLAVALGILALVRLSGTTLADPPSKPAGAVREEGSEPAWLVGVADQELTAVDGSTLSLSPTEGEVVLSFTSHNGEAQKTTFTYMADNLGSVSEEGEGAKVSGFFRQTDTGLEIEYGDGRTASLFANIADGLTMTRRDSSGASVCVSWYPEGHSFSAEERRAAVAAYAESLGIAETPSKKKRKVHAAPANACSPVIRAPMGGTITRAPATHPVEADVPMVSPPAPVVAAAGPAAAPAAVPAPPAPGQAASQCLSVEAGDVNLGFRNRCGYSVQFAFCLQKSTDTAVLCGAGIKTGSVGANGFVALIVRDPQSVTTDHDFRWVGCSGEPGKVFARLESTDPPAGRCVPGN